MLGLPDDVRGCLFDLDGVLTQTAKVHGAAWKEMFDTYLRESAQQTGRPFVAFSATDYEEYVDGKPRYDGVRSFLNSRGIELPEGQDEDPPDAVTVRGLGNRKNEIFTRLVREDGVEAYPGSVHYLRAARDAGLRRAVVSRHRSHLARPAGTSSQRYETGRQVPLTCSRGRAAFRFRTSSGARRHLPVDGPVDRLRLRRRQSSSRPSSAAAMS